VRGGGRLVHDPRRTAALDLRQKGLSEDVIMKLCGWRTRSTFDRYNIIDEDDLARSVELAFDGKQTANEAPVEQDAKQLGLGPVPPARVAQTVRAAES